MQRKSQGVTGTCIEAIVSLPDPLLEVDRELRRERGGKRQININPGSNFSARTNDGRVERGAREQLSSLLTDFNNTTSFFLASQSLNIK